MIKVPVLAVIASCALMAACDGFQPAASSSSKPVAAAGDPPPLRPAVGTPDDALQLTCTNTTDPNAGVYAFKIDRGATAAHVWTSASKTWQDYTNGLTYFSQSDYGTRVIYREVIIVDADKIEIRQDQADEKTNKDDEAFVPELQIRIDRHTNVMNSSGYNFQCADGVAPQIQTAG